MKKRLISLLLLCTLLVSAISLTACSDAKPEAGETTRMTVDINPSVEFMVDDQNKVVSVTALNDDGSILIVGESFIGKTPEAAVELFISLATDTGYLVKGSVEASENNIKISVSGDSKYTETLKKAVTKKAEDTLKTLDIEGKVQQVEALGLTALRALAATTSLYTEEELSKMDEAQLCRVIAIGRMETAQLVTEDMRRAYFSAKEYKISFVEKEETAKVIEQLGGLYTMVHSTYKSALDMYSTAIGELDAFRYDMLVSPESEYQTSLQALRDAKVELLKKRSYTASLTVDGEEYASATVELQAAEEHYNALLSAYEQLGTELNTSIEGLIRTLEQSETALRELENTLFDDNVKEALTAKASEIESKLNEAKDGFFEEFESTHTEDIEAIEQALLAKKQQLKDEIEAAK